MNDMTRNWLTSRPVQEVCDGQRAEAQIAKQILEGLEALAAKTGRLYLDYGPVNGDEGYIMQEAGHFVVGRRKASIGGFVETRHDTLTEALKALPGCGA